MKLQFDGGANPNPGPCAGAYVLYDEDGKEVSVGGVWRESGTNNVGEYLGLLTGLNACLAKGVDEVDVEGDSLLVVSQVNGKWQVKQPHLILLHHEVCECIARFRSVRLRHIPRAQNARADALSDETLARRCDWQS